METETGFECTAYFKGRDGQGTCDTECQWWQKFKEKCPCAKGISSWDGKEHYLNRGKNLYQKDEELWNFPI